MFDLIRKGVMKKGVVTQRYPQEEHVPPEGALGRPEVDLAACDRCGQCAEACPSSCLTLVPEGLRLDLGACLFCGACARACPECITMGREYELAAKRRDDLRAVFRHG